jgi:very-short-patch-repair endonuclease
MKTPNPLFEHRRKRRREQTPAEKLLWSELRNRKPGGFKFRRQHQINRYIVDFYCAEARLVVEIDGAIRLRRVSEDSKRTKDLTSSGYRVVRFTNAEIESDLGGVCEKIVRFCQNGNIQSVDQSIR